MLARDINGLVLEQIQSAQNALKVLLNILQNPRGSLEETTEQTSLLEIFELFGRESQGAGNAACR
jgi:thioredoxin-like negative regulator of GroEL